MNRNAHILVVDSDGQTRGQLNECLQSQGYRVTAVNGGSGMRHVLERKRVDLVLLDVQLRDEDGLTLCRDVCHHTSIPVMICSRLAGELDRIIGLEVGAHDYIPKPFNPRELLSRAKAILRRTLASNSTVRRDISLYRFDAWQLRVLERELIHDDGTRAALTDAEFRLLTELLDGAPQAISRSKLIERLRAREFDPSDRSVDVRISRLRQVLRDPARAPRIIKTVHARGYAIAVVVDRVRGRLGIQ
jgi:two-component system OmpR family response regulator